MFCPKCSSLMMPKEDGGKLSYYCPNCGYETNEGPKGTVSFIKVASDSEGLMVAEGGRKPMAPIVDAVCPKCGHGKAHLEIVQTRAADEPPTRIYTCEKCGYTWREYA